MAQGAAGRMLAVEMPLDGNRILLDLEELYVRALAEGNLSIGLKVKVAQGKLMVLFNKKSSVKQPISLDDLSDEVLERLVKVIEDGPQEKDLGDVHNDASPTKSNSSTAASFSSINSGQGETIKRPYFTLNQQGTRVEGQIKGVPP